MDKFFGKSLALLSVTDKTGLAAFGKGLEQLGLTLLSTGGTAKLLRENGVAVSDVAEYTGSPEILDGRVKTLHPKVHGGILFDRSNPDHASQTSRAGIAAIDIVVVNLYRFKEEAVAKRLSAEEAIEHIDIGGPTMIRAAAKNWQYVLPVIDPSDYPAVLEALRQGGPTRAFRKQLAAKAFAAVSEYDRMIAEFLGEEAGDFAAFPSDWELRLRKVQDLRYGENPHQKAALYAPSAAGEGFASLEILSGKELSYNNILDLDAATALAAEFDAPAVAIIKHTNPCGCATGNEGDLGAIFKRALACDPKSAFGGIVALNRKVDKAAAEAITSIFTECVAAPDFSDDALAVLKQKPNLRVLKASYARRSQVAAAPAALTVRSVQGAFLVQDLDSGSFNAEAWKAVTRKVPSAGELADLRFAMMVAKHVKSNAIVFAKDGATVGIGAGQMSRIDSANIAVAKAKDEGREIRGSVMASDAFFPFRDTVDFAAKQGVTAVVQPGGSKRDQDSVDAANEQGVAMVLTGERHFRH